MLLALVVAAGVALRTLDERQGDDDPRADRAATTTTDGSDESRPDEDDSAEPVDEPTAEPDVAEDPAPDPATQLLDQPLGISLQTGTGVDGAPTLNVDKLGPVRLGSTSSLPYVTSVLGEPDSSGPDQVEPTICDANWVAFGLEAQFYFGHPPSPEASCAKGPVAAALMTGERWFIEPLTGSGSVLKVGESESAIATAFPDARSERLSPGLARLAGQGAGYLVAEGSYGGDPYPTLYVIAVDGSIASFLFVSGAD